MQWVAQCINGSMYLGILPTTTNPNMLIHITVSSPFFCTSTMLVRLTRSAVYADILQVGLNSEFMEYFFENPIFLPFCKAFVDCIPFTITLRKVTPRCTATGKPKYALINTP